MTRSKKRRVGDIVTIPLGGGNFAFGQVLSEPLIAFFDVTAKSELPVEDILNSQVAFSLWVMNHAVTNGEWKVIAHADVNASIDQAPAFFKKDIITGKLSITHDGGDEMPATLQEIEGLERAAVWEPSHIVDRLNDHFSGRPNVWAEHLR